MALLKKVKASTLMETLIATVLIVVVFMISSMILNDVFLNSIKNNTNEIEAYLNELEYLYIHKKLLVPYQDDFNVWQISVERNRENGFNNIVFEAINSNTNKSIIKTIIASKN
jgi:predicted PurR-regulated permease PerM